MYQLTLKSCTLTVHSMGRTVYNYKHSIYIKLGPPPGLGKCHFSFPTLAVFARIINDLKIVGVSIAFTSFCRSVLHNFTIAACILLR
jgi:hypothetical protein